MSMIMANAMSSCPSMTRVKKGSCSPLEKVPGRMNVQSGYLQFQCCHVKVLNGTTLSKPLGDCTKIPFHGTSVSGFSSRGALFSITSILIGMLFLSTSIPSSLAASLQTARFSAEQTQTITREAPTITHVPGKENSLQLDDGDSGLPPPNDDGGGGGGGGGGGWSGGFFFFGFLAFLGLIRDKESEED